MTRSRRIAKGAAPIVLMLMLGASLLAGMRAVYESPAPSFGPIPFESPLDLIVLEVRIGESEPLRFGLDSGATSTIIDTEVAKRLELPLESASTSRGTAAGSRITISPVKGGVTFSLTPELEISVPEVIAAQFKQTAKVLIGEDLDGILGSEIFRQFTVEVDYARDRITFHEPERYEYSGEGSVHALVFPDDMPALPFTDITVENGERKLERLSTLVDSGGMTMGTLGIGVRSNWDRLITPKNRLVPILGATGISDTPEGTTHEAWMTRMSGFSLGPHSFERPFVSQSGGGPRIPLFGATLLHRFTAVFDYERARLILEPNSEFDDEFPVDRSGLTLVADREDPSFLSVLFVSEGLPGAALGIRKDDRILSIAGTPVENLGLAQAREILCRPGRVELIYEHGEERHEKVLDVEVLFPD